MLIPKGTILYHGTSTDTKFFKLNSPAWFTSDFQLASIFAAELAGTPGSKPRVYCYKVKKNLNLPELSQSEAADLESSLAGQFDGRYSAAAREFCKKNLGWVIPKLYDKYAEEVMTDETSIDDIMICDLSVLDYLEQKAIDTRHYLDYAWLKKLRPLIQRASGRPQSTLAGQIDLSSRVIRLVEQVAHILKNLRQH